MTRWPLSPGQAPNLALAGAASLLELGPICALLRGDQGLTAALAAGLSYQAGNALAGRLAIPAPVAALAAGGGAMAMALLPPGAAGWFAALGIASLGLQSVRRGRADRPDKRPLSPAAKRAARVLGFAVAGLAPWTVLAVLIVFAVGGPHGAPAVHRREPHSGAPVKPLHVLMVLHQAHYFSYCYAIPVLLDRPPLGGSAMTGVWFGFGWVTYLLAERLWRPLPPRAALVVGHLMLAAALLGLAAAADRPAVAAALWVLTGLCGGTVFCFAALDRAAGSPHGALERAEDIGHVAGVAFALATIVALGPAPAVLPLLGAILAIATALGAWRIECPRFVSLNPFGRQP